MPVLQHIGTSTLAPLASIPSCNNSCLRLLARQSGPRVDSTRVSPLDSLDSRPRTREGAQKEGNRKISLHTDLATLQILPIVYPCNRLPTHTTITHVNALTTSPNSPYLPKKKSQTDQTFRYATQLLGFLLPGCQATFLDLGALSIRLPPAFLSPPPARPGPRSYSSNNNLPRC